VRVWLRSNWWKVMAAINILILWWNVIVFVLFVPGGLSYYINPAALVAEFFGSVLGAFGVWWAIQKAVSWMYGSRREEDR